MIGVVMILGSRGDLILSRVFRDNLNVRLLADTFRLELIGTKKAERCPVNVISKVAYMHMRFENMYLVCCAHSDASAMATFQYMIRLLQILYNYLDEGVNDATVRKHFVTIQQIIDETMDYGYPQMTEVQLLKTFIALEGSDSDDESHMESVATKKRQAQQITVKATGAIPWRAENIVHDVNCIWLDVLEDINLLLSQNGTVLQCEVSGRLVVRSLLSGMPQCSITLNDGQLLQAAHLTAQKAAASAAAIGEKKDERHDDDNDDDGDGGRRRHPRERKEFALDDCSFHQCVKLGSLDTDKAINFVPPDGEFILMRYRTTASIEPPFRLVNSRVQEISRSRFEVAFFLKSHLPIAHAATDVKITIPTPKNVANVNIAVTKGKAKYDPTKNAIIWKLAEVHGSQFEVPFRAEVQLLPSTLESERSWSRPPIVMSFQVGGLALSGVKVTSVRAEEAKMGYAAKKMVRYISAAGQYQMRI